MKRVLLAVTGSVAIYKAQQLARLLSDRPLELKIVMTENATRLVSPVLFQSLTYSDVYTDMWSPKSPGGMDHIDLAKWADMIIVAPATADTLAKMAAGLADNLLLNILLASSADVYVAPAMNQTMWHHLATQQNIKTPQSRGVNILGPASGRQACQDVGDGRMLEPDDIMAEVFSTGALVGKKVLMTVGATQEPIDPVRFISNRSSGKMGWALAAQAHLQGAEVTVVQGVVTQPPPAGIKIVPTQRAQEMHDQCLLQIESHTFDYFVGVAAVADYTVAQPLKEKHEKHEDYDDWTLTLSKNPDIAQAVSQHANRPRCCIGFSAQSNMDTHKALKKKEKKGLDVMVLNDISVPGLGFDAEKNALWLSDGQNSLTLKPATKTQLAQSFWAWVQDNNGKDKCS